MKRIGKIGVWIFLVIVGLFFSFFKYEAPQPISLAIVERSFKSIDSVFAINSVPKKGKTQIGWARASITPDFPTQIAGFGIRETHTGVHDSIYVRALSLSSESTNALILSYDLLLVTPHLKELIDSTLQSSGMENYYISASHSHQSIGGFGSNTLEHYVLGETNPKIVELILSATKKACETSIENSRSLNTINYEEATATQCYNRVTKENNLSLPYQRIMFSTDSNVAKLHVFGAHPTIIKRQNSLLSGEYPNQLLKLDTATQFSIFMSGLMGSSSPKTDSLKNLNSATDFAKKLWNTDIEAVYTDSGLFDLTKRKITLPSLSLAPKLSTHFSSREWLFKASTRDETPNYIDVLKLNNLLFVGLPVELSGVYQKELMQHAKAKGLNLVLTCFNGTYLGYATPPIYNEITHSETREMNWTGKYGGDYYRDLVKRIIEREAK